MASSTCDLVVKYEVLKAQNALEEKARNEWGFKWSFYLDFDKILLKKAAERGLSEAEYKKRTVLRKPKGSVEPNIWKVEPAKFMPDTTIGMVGWRAQEEYSLEKFGRMYISPKYTLPYEPPLNSIFLG
ncbi:unnamed protein product [Ceutorhynchus assimilis]|uniref:Uncharacterized protein n=1 Tax=Ceutorhynchus assimilis TaxID=467358 RepID=A0A9N9MT46_9CUCU|nr:unnamed protein product [Ceutorhynchus assimilis]